VENELKFLLKSFAIKPMNGTIAKAAKTALLFSPGFFP